MARAQLGLAHSYSRAKVKFNVNKSDNMIIQVGAFLGCSQLLLASLCGVLRLLLALWVANGGGLRALLRWAPHPTPPHTPSRPP